MQNNGLDLPVVMHCTHCRSYILTTANGVVCPAVLASLAMAVL